MMAYGVGHLNSKFRCRYSAELVIRSVALVRINASCFGRTTNDRKRLLPWKPLAIVQFHNMVKLLRSTTIIFMWSVEQLDSNIHVMYTGNDAVQFYIRT